MMRTGATTVIALGILLTQPLAALAAAGDITFAWDIHADPRLACSAGGPTFDTDLDGRTMATIACERIGHIRRGQTAHAQFVAWEKVEQADGTPRIVATCQDHASIGRGHRLHRRFTLWCYLKSVTS